MRMGMVRMPRREGTMLAGAPDEDRLPRDEDEFYIRCGCVRHIESYSRLILHFLSILYPYISVMI